MSSELTVFDMIIALSIIPIYFIICVLAVVRDCKKHKDDVIEEETDNKEG